MPASAISLIWFDYCGGERGTIAGCHAGESELSQLWSIHLIKCWHCTQNATRWCRSLFRDEHISFQLWNSKFQCSYIKQDISHATINTHRCTHRPRTDHFSARSEPLGSLWFGRARRIVIRNLLARWHLTMKHFHMMYQPATSLR